MVGRSYITIYFAFKSIFLSKKIVLLSRDQICSSKPLYSNCVCTCFI